LYIAYIIYCILLNILCNACREFENSLTRDYVAAAVIFENIYYFFFCYTDRFSLVETREVYLLSVPPRCFRVKRSKKKNSNIIESTCASHSWPALGSILFVLTSLLCIYIYYIQYINIIYSHPPRCVVIMFRRPVYHNIMYTIFLVEK